MKLTKQEQLTQLQKARIQTLRDKAVSCMSNSKWKRLLQIVADTEMASSISEWCFIGNEKRYRSVTPGPDCCLSDGSGIDDVSAMGPFVFRDIHFVHWPRCCQNDRTAAVESQQVDLLHQALVHAGQFELKLDQSGLTVWGYLFPEALTSKVME